MHKTKYPQWLRFWSMAGLICLSHDLMAQTWNNSAAVQQSGIGEGLGAVYSIIFTIFWVVAAIMLGMAVFKFKEGDTKAALFSIGGAVFLALIPKIITFLKGTLGGDGQMSF